VIDDSIGTNEVPLVEKHGGSVEARSDGPGLGSEFEVRLPLIDEKSADAFANSPVSGTSS